MRKEPAMFETVDELLYGDNDKCKGAETVNAWLVQGTERRPLWLGRTIARSDSGLR